MSFLDSAAPTLPGPVDGAPTMLPAEVAVPRRRYTRNIPPNSKLHKKLCERIRSRVKMAERAHTQKVADWLKAEDTALAYVPEQEADSVRRNRRDQQGLPSYTTIQLPYSYALLLSAHTYITSVFFARSPVHQFTGQDGQNEMNTQALEALINYQIEAGEAMARYYIWPYDALKYGLGVLGHYWTQDLIHYGDLVEMDGQLLQATHETVGYEGNKCYNVCPLDFMPDPRVPVGRFQEGEFLVIRKDLLWNDILRREELGYYMNVDEIRKHVTSKSRDYSSGDADGGRLVRPRSPTETYLDDYSWDEQGMNEKKESHPGGGVFFEVYVDLVPREWGVGDSGYPQKWVFTVTEDLDLVIGAQPLGFMHGKFPFDVMETELEAYGLYNRGIPKIMEPIQNTMDWLVNSHFYNVRATLNNQFIVDPSKLVIKDVRNAGPGFIWRLRPEAYGTDINTIFKQVNVTDVTRNNIADLQLMTGVAERVTGVNDQMMGLLAGGGRKTATEVRTSTGFGVNRMKTMAEYISATAFAPHARKLVAMSQQFYDTPKKMRLVGDLANFTGPGFYEVQPEDIAGGWQFVSVDGTLPVDRMAQANLWKEIFATLPRMPPQMVAQYDLAKMFGWMATIAGLKNIQQFKIQVVPDQQIAQQAAAGNVIPIGRPGGIAAPGNAASTAAGLNALVPPPLPTGAPT